MERRLYDFNGQAVAYIADDGERTICLWNGLAVAYIDDRLDCYGWNGHCLGWVEGGVLFDTQGQSIGIIQAAYSTRLRSEPGRHSKRVTYAKHPKSPPCSRPMHHTGNSRLPLADYLWAGLIEAMTER
ncbi:4-fold beta flower protein [Geothrix sp. PMB-07]|uniref:4-fold beta flower protein n=1 Tax=Geothrix sp. PMB-07 TaxID=3068640 RepID=UPI002741EACB|nr:hypothetical protein [Geothrix sp. PMB-07]WLT30427.1 hypothetical protein Q9293_11935 [Geothrix sp. PMB-07]